MIETRMQTALMRIVIAGLLVVQGCNQPSSETVESAVEPEQTEEAAAVSESEAVIGEATTETPEATDSAADTEPAAFYVVAKYDKSVDPWEDLSQTVAKAKAEDKRIILQVGGDWCPWCARISEYMSTNVTVRDHLLENFLVMKVTYPSDFSEAFLASYPECEAYPHFFVLNTNGKLLHSQGTGELEKGEGYDEATFMAFLNQWTL